MLVKDTDKRKLIVFRNRLFYTAISLCLMDVVYGHFIKGIHLFENPVTNTMLLLITIGLLLDRKTAGS